jgi:hypothetical protein
MKKDTKETFKVDSSSDFYIISSESIVSYQLKGGLVKELNKSTIKMPDVVISGFHKGEFGNKTLVISGGDGSDFTKDERLISIDFNKGTVNQKQTEHYAYTGSGYSDKYFYTFQSTTEDGGMYQFDKLGNEKNSYMFDISTTPAPQFTGLNNKLYLAANQASNNNEFYETKLFVFDEESLALLETIPLEENKEEVSGFMSSTVIDNELYIPISETRNRQTYERTPNNTFLQYNLETGEKEYFTLPDNFPHLIYTSKTNKYLTFVHEPHSLQKSAVSVFNRETKQSNFIDVGEIIGNHDVMESKIMSVNTDKENQLFLLTKVGLVVWDMEENKLLNKYTDVDKTAFYLWVNE